MRPPVGFKPNTPQNAAGMRILPPKSEPTPSGDPPEAMSDASPPELPPAERSGFQGLRVNPNTRFVVSVEALMSGQFVLPNTIAPAALRRRTASASVPAMLSR